MEKLLQCFVIIKLISPLIIMLDCTMFSQKVANKDVACLPGDLPDFTIKGVKTKFECILWCLHLNKESRTCSRINFHKRINYCSLYTNSISANWTLVSSSRLKDDCVGYEMKKCMDQTFTYVAGIGTCLKVVTSKTNWSNGQAFCNGLSASAHLVVFKNILEIAEISKFLTSRNDSQCFGDGGRAPSFWTAGQRIDQNRNTSFIWKPYPGIEQPFLLDENVWFPDEPNFSGTKESCVHMWKEFKFNDASCANSNCFVCQMESEF